MPSLPFVLPHWLYWGTLVVFPIVAIYFVQRQLRSGVPRGPSLFIAYLFWLCSGFMGLHRLYLRNNWGFIFIPVFLLILHTTDVIRDKREDVSRTRAAVGAAASELDHAKIPPGVTATPQMQERLAKAEAAAAEGQIGVRGSQADLARWYSYSRWLAILMAAMLVGDAILLPGLVRRQKLREAAEQRKCAARNRGAGRAADRHPRRPDVAHPHALYRRDRMGEHPRRRVRGLLGRDLGVRLLLRGDRALRVQFTDQLAA